MGDPKKCHRVGRALCPISGAVGKSGKAMRVLGGLQRQLGGLRCSQTAGRASEAAVKASEEAVKASEAAGSPWMEGEWGSASLILLYRQQPQLPIPL